MRRWFIALALTTCVIAACGGTVAPTKAPLAQAVADALATIDEIDRQYQAWDSASGSAAFQLIASVATKGRQSLARESAQISTMRLFQLYDIGLKLVELQAVLQDRQQLKQARDALYSIRGEIAALAP
jgi:hypothetical protein